jgi:ubiquinone/menaquinone biosynthesis C-methylase UbiE
VRDEIGAIKLTTPSLATEGTRLIEVDYDQTEMPAAYDAGRGYSPRALRHWLETVSRNIPVRQGSRILDVGCGTGRFSAALAEHFGSEVDAIDPSEKMLEQARRKPHAGVRFQKASGEQLPFPDESVDLVFMSMVFHHFDAPEIVAQECCRVLRPTGSLCLRAGTREQISTYPYVPFFPASASILYEILQSREFVESVFLQAGLCFVHHELVRNEVATSWKEYAIKLSHRADSVLTRLTNEEFQLGLELVRDYAARQPQRHPVIELVDFFVFRLDEKPA